MSAFDDMDALALEAVVGVFGDLCTIYPMKPGPAGINGPRVEDDSRDPLDDVPVIRSRWASHASISGGGEGIPNYPGAFKQGVSGSAHIATIQLSGLGWRPRQGDELAYADAPDARFRISEPMLDGLSGLHLGLTKV